MILSLLLSVSSTAHPIKDQVAAHTLSLTVLPSHLEVDCWVDVPNAFLQGQGAEEERLLRAMGVELASGLLLTVDGNVLSMRPRTPSPQPSASSEHTMGFALHFEAYPPPLTASSHIELSTANLQGASNLFALDLKVHPAIQVRETSVLTRRAPTMPAFGPARGQIVRDETLRWQKSEEARTLSVTLARPLPRWWTTLTFAGTQPIRAAKALAPRGTDLLRPDVDTPEIWLVSLGLAASIGASIGRTEGLRTLGVALLGVPLALLSVAGNGWAELITGLAVVSWGIAVRELAVACGLAVAGLAATTHALGPAAGLLVGLAFGLSLRVQVTRAAAWPLIWLVTSLLLLRSLSA